MASEFRSVELSGLSRFEHDAVSAFSKKAIEQFGSQVVSLSVHGLKDSARRETGVVELLVILKKSSPLLEAKIEDLALDHYVEMGINLRITCFEQKQFKTFQKMKLPRVTALTRGAVALYAAA